MHLLETQREIHKGALCENKGRATFPQHHHSSLSSGGETHTIRPHSRDGLYIVLKGAESFLLTGHSK